MLILAAFAFLVAFALTALVLVGSGAGASKEIKQTLLMLDSALAAAGNRVKDELVDVRKQELLSAIPWLNRLLIKLEIAPRLRRLLYQADVKWTPGAVLLMSLACFVFSAYLIYLRTAALPVAVLLGLLIAAAPFVYILRKRTQRFNKFEQGLPAALDMMVSALRGGYSLVSAIGLVAREVPDPIGKEFRICFDEQNYGLELRTALDNLATRVPIGDVQIIVTAILIQKETGGNLAEVLDKSAQIIRDRFRLKKQIRIHTAQGRLTGWILSFLPLGLGIALYLVSPNQVSLLWTHPTGRKMLYTASVMTLVGAFIIRKLVRLRV